MASHLGKILVAAVMAGMAGPVGAALGPQSLAYDPHSRSAAAIPESEKALQTVTAEPWFHFPDSETAPGKGMPVDGGALKVLLEGSVFDRDGNLLFVDVVSGRAFRLTPGKQLTPLTSTVVAGAAGVAVHPNGDLFIAGIGNGRTGGTIMSVRPDGSSASPVVVPDRGQIPDDLVFDAHGGFYFSDFRGSVSDPVGGIYYVAPDGKTITPFMRNLALPNGVALSPAGDALWFGEAGRNLLHRVQLSAPAQSAVFGATTPYYFGNARPDSMRVDADGNLYVALLPQGRIMVFNAHGFPIGQILVPGREKDLFLYTTAIAIRPGTNELYILSSDGQGGGATIFRSGAFTKAASLPAN